MVVMYSFLSYRKQVWIPSFFTSFSNHCTHIFFCLPFFTPTSFPNLNSSLYFTHVHKQHISTADSFHRRPCSKRTVRRTHRLSHVDARTVRLQKWLRYTNSHYARTSISS